MKSLYATRWSARYEAVQVLNQHFKEIIKTLIILEEDTEENAITRQEAKGIRIQLENSNSNSKNRIQQRKLHADESRDRDVQLSGRDHFRVNIFNVILDNLDSELLKRCAAYEKNQEKFSVITEFSNLDNREIRKRAERLRNVYSSNLKSSLDNEFGHFHAYCTEKMIEQNSPFDLLKLSHANELYTAFPNVKITNRIFMSYDISCKKLAQNYRFHV